MHVPQRQQSIAGTSQGKLGGIMLQLQSCLGALAIPENRVYRALLVVAGIAGQVGWLYIAWWVDGQDFTPP